jgi:D-alanyl-D-alanine carboxypeptidase/D-alanyl-D-alanine-endopeptidase (penicillin-binding protein 4)
LFFTQKYRSFAVLITLASLTAAIAAQRSRAFDASPDWDFVLDQNGGTRVHFSVSLGGQDPYTRNADDVMPPASLSKLFTAGAALERLGADFHFETRIEWRNPFPRDEDKISDLTILGAGDPSWGMADWNETIRMRFDQIAQTLKDQHVREVHGAIRLAAQDPRWENVAPPVGWLEGDLGQCEGALPQAFNIQLNCATLVVESPSESHWKEEGLSAPVKMGVEWGNETHLRVEREGEGYRVVGTWVADGTPVYFSVPVHNTADWAEHLLTRALEAKGIRILPRVRTHAGSGLYVLANHSASLYSPPLRELLKPLLKDNSNLLGESLYIAMGGQQTMREYLNAHLPDQKTIALWDGSGLSRSNTVSASAVMNLLDALKTSPNFKYIWDALSIAGVDGTLATRMRGTAAEGVLRGKPGALRGYYHLAGFVPRYDAAGNTADFTPFVILAEAPPESRETARIAEDRVGAELVRLSNY